MLCGCLQIADKKFEIGVRKYSRALCSTASSVKRHRISEVSPIFASKYPVDARLAPAMSIAVPTTPDVDDMESTVATGKS